MWQLVVGAPRASGNGVIRASAMSQTEDAATKRAPFAGALAPVCSSILGVDGVMRALR
jgi:hypothetical protein